MAFHVTREDMQYCAPVLIVAVTNMYSQGAGNVFKGEEAAQAKHASNDNAIEDKVEGLAAKGKALFFGKKDKEQTTKP